MKIKIKDFSRIYFYFISYLFLALLLGTMSFGRAFSLLHAGAVSGVGHVFITELFLFVGLPLLFLRHRELFAFPRMFNAFFLIFYIFGLLYLLKNVCAYNLFALRDFVLCGYMLFFYLAFLIFSDKRMLMAFIIVLAISNFINLFIGRMMLLNAGPLLDLGFFLRQIKYTNLGLYYGIALSFLISFYPVISKMKIRALAILLISADMYMLIFLSKRTIWLALLSLVVFFIFIHRFTFVKILMKIAPFVIVICVLLFCFDSRTDPRNHNEKNIRSKLKTMLILATCSSKPLGISAVLPVQRKETTVPVPVKNKANSVSALVKNKESRVLLSAKDKDICVSLAGNDIENLANMVWRFGIWKQTIKFGLKSPLFGRGFGIYPHYEMYGQFLAMPKKDMIDSGVVPAHNDLLTIFFKMGLVGLAFYLFLNIYVFIYVLKHIGGLKDEFRKHFLIALLGCFIFWHMAALFFDVIDSPPTSIFLWIIMGMIFAVIGADKKIIRPKKQI